MTAPEALAVGDGEPTGWEAEPSPQHPHVALLLGGTLLVVGLACVLPFFVVQNVREGSPHLVLASTLALTLVCGLGPFATHRLQNTQYVVGALVLLDLLPLVIAASLSADTPVRQWCSLLLIPVLIAAATLPPRIHQAELIAGCLVGTVIMVNQAESAEEGLLTCLGFTLFIVICASLARQDRAALDLRFELWQRRSRTDELTGLLNRRGFVAEFPEVRRSCLAADTPVGVVMIDIDHFSRINAEQGHAYGDTVLQRICAVVSDLPELAGGLVARIGGEELIVVVPRPSEPLALALRAALARARVHPGLTVSMGICDADPADCADPEAMWRLVTVADAAMYRAKELGRDRYVRAGTPHPGEPPLPTGVRVRSGAIGPAPAPRWSPAPPGPELPVLAARTDGPDDGPDDPTDARLFGAYCVVFAAIGLVAWITQVAIEPDSRWLPVFGGGLVAMVGLGTVAVIRGRRTPPVLTVISCVAIELCTLSAVLATSEVEHRLMVICVLTVPVLVSAHAMPLPWLAGQIALVFVGVGLAASDSGPIDAAWMHRTLGLAAVICAAPAVLFWLRRRREQANARLRRLVAIDPLTGVYNRTGLEREVLGDHGSSTVHVRAFNVDGFKTLNDTYGHVFGDEVLTHLARTLAAAAAIDTAARTAGQPAPLVGRTGGDRFVVIEADPPSAALTDRLRRAVLAFPVGVSVSVGEATGPLADAAGMWSLIAQAEAALVRPVPPRRTGPTGVSTGTVPPRLG